MTSSRTKRKPKELRDPGGFAVIPWSVIDSPAYQSLPHTARALLVEFVRQVSPDYLNNGRLLASRRHLGERGWTSSDVIYRAKQALLAGGFIHETVKGRRPNRASWYAVTWISLPRHAAYDHEAMATFDRSAYAKTAALVRPKVRKRPDSTG